MQFQHRLLQYRLRGDAGARLGRGGW
jgi:hypothetical protein